MVATGISEFTFGYAFLYEQTQRNWANLKAAPVLPSLQREAEAGWDANLPLQGVDYYYQFKLSEYLSRRNAKYIKDGTYNAGYFRFGLHRRDNNRQHRRLREHCQANPFTYYVAPEFGGLSQFNASFLAREIMDKSRIIPLSECEDIMDGAEHHITYQTGSNDWILHSSPKRHGDSRSGKDIEQLYRASHDEWRPITEVFAHDIFEKTVSTVRSRLSDERRRDRSVTGLLDLAPDERNRTGYLQRAAELVSVFYGLTMVLVGVPRNADAA